MELSAESPGVDATSASHWEHEKHPAVPGVFRFAVLLETAVGLVTFFLFPVLPQKLFYRFTVKKEV